MTFDAAQLIPKYGCHAMVDMRQTFEKLQVGGNFKKKSRSVGQTNGKWEEKDGDRLKL